MVSSSVFLSREPLKGDNNKSPNIGYSLGGEKASFFNSGSGALSRFYLGAYDVSDRKNINLLDALVVDITRSAADAGVVEDGRETVVMTDDGLALFAVNRWMDGSAQSFRSSLNFVDLLVLDLASTSPAKGASGVHLDKPIVLNFTQPIGYSEDELLSYINLHKDNGTADLESVAFTLSFEGDDRRTVVVTPEDSLESNQRYVVNLTGVASSRRTQGLFDYALDFVTGSATGPELEFISLEPSVSDVDGGLVNVVLNNGGNAPSFMVSGQAASVISSTPNDDGSETYSVQVPGNS